MWNDTSDAVFSIQVKEDMLGDQQLDSVNNIDIRFECNTTNVIFDVNESVSRGVALAAGRGNRAILDAGQFFILLWLSVVAGNWRHVFIISTIFIGSLMAHLLGQTFAQDESGDKRRLIISILAPR